MEDRIKRIFSNMDKKIDTFLIANGQHPNIDLNFFYTSGITSGSFEGCCVVAKSNGKGYLLTSELEEAIARKESKLEVRLFKTKEEREAHLKELLSDVNNLGINSDGLSYKQYQNISKFTKARMADISNAFAKARSIKDNEEIKSISEACKISSQSSEPIRDLVKEGITEKQLAGKISSLVLENGATSLAFPTIVAFGENSSRPHHLPTDRKLKKNEFVLLDFGAEFNRYASDMSRTFVFGKATEGMRDIYETVLDAQLQAIDMVHDGVNGKDVDKLSRNIIDKEFKGRFIHSLGHEVGLSVHDGNRLSSQADFILKKNMVVTVEPGIYIPEIGGVRIEDTMLVTRNNAKILTSSPKELMEI